MKESNDITEYHKLNEDKNITIQMGSYTTDTDKLLSHKISENISGKNPVRNSIRLLTYNFFCRPPPVNTNKDDYKDARLKDFLEQLPNFDIICFQELFTTLILL